ncbi:hypothetical protein HHK36_010106 [Tetracentron sinense]|uniref:BURP domain-containing protein n=1 Tax=Tetracentron sinense TaxID=13715 RepID=A0A834ZED7_TETSI|nr:hypothetical protein HHK36_010106 [Tetracentron sinense]
MGRGLGSWSLFFHVLIMMCAHGNAAREPLKVHWKGLTGHDHENKQLMEKQIYAEKEDDHNRGTNLLRLHSMDGDAMDDHLLTHRKQEDDDHKGINTKHIHAHHSSHMDHMDPSLNVFFIEKDLKIGKTMVIHFPNRDPSSSPHFLPKDEAISIPFSSTKLSHLLQVFSFSEGSPQAKAMEDTLRQCEHEPIKGETKFCATSLESMLDFARSIFGIGVHFKVLTTTHHKNSASKSQTSLLQNYTVLEVPTEIPASKMIACHTMPYPYAVFYCHHQKSESKVFKVSLGGEYGERVEAVAVCHMDTSAWGRDHVSFRVLGIEPGTPNVCHFFPADHLVWVP